MRPTVDQKFSKKVMIVKKNRIILDWVIVRIVVDDANEVFLLEMLIMGKYPAKLHHANHGAMVIVIKGSSSQTNSNLHGLRCDSREPIVWSNLSNMPYK